MEGLRSAEWPFAATTTAGMKQAQSWRCQMDFLLIFGYIALAFVAWLILSLVLPDAFFSVDRLWRWLKGSEMIYWLGEDGSLKSYWNRGYFLANLNANAIGISRGPFGHRGAIYGSAAKNWRIAGIYRIMIEVDCVELEGLSGVPVETALKIINTYPSPQAMLDRTDNLEKELVHARFKVAERAAALQALNQKITTAKHRFRGSPAKEIQANIQFALRETGEQHVYRQMVDGWLEKLEKPEAKILN